MVPMIAALLLTIAFLLELAALVAAGIVGASLGSPPFGFPGSVAGAGLFAAVWGLFLAPRARFPQSAGFRRVAGALVIETAAAGLIVVGHVAAGAILGAAVLANAIALAATGATPESLTREAPHR